MKINKDIMDKTRKKMAKIENEIKQEKECHLVGICPSCGADLLKDVCSECDYKFPSKELLEYEQRFMNRHM